MICTMKFKRILALTVSFLMICSSAAVTFASGDTSGHWAESDINYLVSRNYVKGDDNGDIRPDATITRAEFVTVVNRIFGYTQKAESNFIDISASAWYYEQFLTAKAHGYLSGDENGNANPEDPITRAETAVIVSRIMKLSAANPPSFTDASDFPEWAADAIAALAEKGLLSGYADGSFGADARITRAEAFVVFSRVVKGQTNHNSGNSGNIIGPGSPSRGGGTSSGNAGGSSGGGNSGNVSESAPAITKVTGKKITWTSVKNTNRYKISVLSEKIIKETFYETTETSFDFDEETKNEFLPTGEDLSANETVKVKVKALKNAPYQDSAYSNTVELHYTFEDSIAATDEIKMETEWNPAETRYLLKWNPVEGASAYRVRIELEGKEVQVTRPAEAKLDITSLIEKYGKTAVLKCYIKTLSNKAGQVASDEVPFDACAGDGDNGRFSGGNGTAENPYLIYTLEQFHAMGNGDGKHYLLKSNLVLPENDYIAGEFTGSLKGDVDGKRAVITVNINLPNELNVGLVGNAGACTIENLQVEGSITGKAYVGGIVGFSGATSVINCFNNASVTAVNSPATVNACAGGIIGYVNGNSVIKDCINFGKIESTAARNTAGIAGYATNSQNMVIENCENNGEIVGHGNNVGGIAGYMNYGLITKCRNNGTVTATGGSIANVGGIAGANYDRIEQCYNTGAVTGINSTTGGITGTHSGKTTIGAYLNNNYNTGAISHAGIAGAAGGNDAKKVIKWNYNIGQTEAGKEAFSTVPPDSVLESNYFLDEKETANANAVGLTSAKMQDLSNFQGFDPAIWTIGVTEGYPYPTLINNPHKAAESLPVPLPALTAPADLELIVTEDDVYTLTFTGDSNAKKHVIYITGSAPIETTALSVDVSAAFSKAGDYEIGIRSVGDGVNYQDSMWSEIITRRVIKEKILTAPSELKVTEEAGVYTLSFKGDVNAQRHKIMVDEIVFETENGEIQEADITAALKEFREYTIRVISIGDGKTYLDSEEVSIQYTVVDKTILSAPTDVSVTWGGETGTEDVYTLHFTFGNSADFHEISLLKEGEAEPVTVSNVTASSVNLNEYVLGAGLDKAGVYTITVSAKKGEDKQSASPVVIDSRFAGTRNEAEETYQLIGCLRHLKNIAEDGKYIQIADITEALTEPIALFKGKYIGDGETQKIVTLKLEDMTTEGVADAKTDPRGITGIGMFREIRDTAYIENIRTEGSVKGNKLNGVGGIVGVSSTDTAIIIRNCVNNAAITKAAKTSAGTEGTGGIIGNQYGMGSKGARIENCENLGSVTGVSYVGGIAGYSRALVTGCTNKGTLFGSNVGGITGANYGQIEKCRNLVDIDIGSNSTVGGISGLNSGGNKAQNETAYNIKECYNTGNIKGKSYVAGIAANYQAGSVDNFYGIRDCYNTGKIIGESIVGGIIGQYGRKGRSGTAMATNCYDAQKQTMMLVGVMASGATDKLELKNAFFRKADDTATDTFHGEGKTLNELKRLLTAVSDFNANGVWLKEEPYSLPQLMNNKHIGDEPEPDDGAAVDVDISGITPQNIKISATAADKYNITFDVVAGADWYEISLLKEDASEPEVLNTETNRLDITASVVGDTEANVGKYTITVTAQNNTYSSQSSAAVTLDSHYAGGEGTEDAPYKVANVRHLKNIDLHKEAHYLQIEDFTIEDGYTPVCADFNNRFNGTYRGKQDLEHNLKYKTVHFNNVTAPAQFFGLFGSIGENAVVEFIGTTGSVTSAANYVGGIAYQNLGTISNCYSAADLATTGLYCGGITGDNRGIIENCYTAGNISAASYAAGIAAITANGNRNVRISKCYATGDMTVTNNYACGIIGGVGLSTGASTNLKVVIEDCYFTGMINGGGRSGGIIGLSAECGKQGKVEVVLQRNFVTNTGYANKIYGYALSGTYKADKTFRANDTENFYLTGGTASAHDRSTGLSAEDFKTLIDRDFGTAEAPKIPFPSSVWEMKDGFDFPQLISNPHK